jgi:hypothetical protein
LCAIDLHLGLRLPLLGRSLTRSPSTLHGLLQAPTFGSLEPLTLGCSAARLDAED